MPDSNIPGTLPTCPENSSLPADRTEPRVPKDREPGVGVIQGRLERIFSGSRDLAADLMEVVDLKMQLLQVEVEERVEARLNAILQRALVGGVALGGLILLLFAAAFGLGGWLGHTAWGFLVVSLLLFLAAFVTGRVRWQMVRVRLREEGGEGAPEMESKPPQQVLPLKDE